MTAKSRGHARYYEVLKQSAKKQRTKVQMMKMTMSRTLLLLALVFVTARHSVHAYYNPAVGKWLTRDPIEEGGGKNLLAILANDCKNNFDVLGLERNTVYYAIPCGPCDGGPILGATSRTLRDWRWHIWGRSWQENTIQIHIQGIPVTPPIHVPGSGGYYVIAGGWVVIDAKCKIPTSGWSLVGFRVNQWPSISPNMVMTVKCIYQCDTNRRWRVNIDGEGFVHGPPPIQNEANTSPDSPPPQWLLNF